MSRAAQITRQWLWFVGLWAAGVLSLGAVAFGLRLLFHPATRL